MSFMFGSSVAPRQVRVLGLFLFLLVAGPAAALTASRTQATTSVSTIDARLILHPHTVVVHSRMSRGAEYTLSVYPALPGRNTVRLVVTGSTRPRLGIGHASVAAFMAEMRMNPVHTRLAWDGRAFSGAINLSMFGRYEARVTVVVGGSHMAGRAVLPLSLQGSWTESVGGFR